MSRASPARRPTATAAFGSSRRESHDASPFYSRFVPPVVINDAVVVRPGHVDVVHCHDARDMSAVESDSVALVVTSPPYFAGKDYEQSLGQNGVPGSYFEYLELLADVFSECRRILEPGGRIAVNVANLGRRPFRSLAGDVTDVLQRLGLLLRGEVVWWKGRAAGGSCAWGTFQSPANPVLRDVTERIVIASKGRFDRAIEAGRRSDLGLPSIPTITKDEFLEATTDLWDLPPESATRVGHPAPFPVELPERLIELYTYEGDVVLDPFMGSGSTAVAAVRTRRHYIGFDTDPAYCATARQRIAASRPAPAAPEGGRMAKEISRNLVETCGFTDLRTDVNVRGLGITLDLVARDRAGTDWAFGVCGGFSSSRSGLRRSDTLWRAIGGAAVLHASESAMPLVLLATEVPALRTAGHMALSAVLGPGRPVVDVIELLDPDGRERLGRWAANGPPLRFVSEKSPSR